MFAYFFRRMSVTELLTKLASNGWLEQTFADRKKYYYREGIP